MFRKIQIMCVLVISLKVSFRLARLNKFQHCEAGLILIGNSIHQVLMHLQALNTSFKNLCLLLVDKILCVLLLTVK